MMHRFAFSVLLLTIGVFLTGCQTQENGWRKFYSPSPRAGVIKSFTSENPEIRLVTSQQVKDYLAKANKYIDERHIAPEDITSTDARVLRQIELDAFLINEDPDSVAPVGNSSFDGPVGGSRDDKQLIAFAESVGASFVVLMVDYLGQVDGYTSVPVTSSEYASANAYVTNNRGGWAQGFANGLSTSTTYVPVATKYPRYSNLAIYYRRISPDERAAINATFKKGVP